MGHGPIASALGSIDNSGIPLTREYDFKIETGWAILIDRKQKNAYGLLHKVSKEAGLSIECLDLFDERSSHGLHSVEDLGQRKALESVMRTTLPARPSPNTLTVIGFLLGTSRISTCNQICKSLPQVHPLHGTGCWARSPRPAQQMTPTLGAVGAAETADWGRQAR
jgi:hypothetical protein